MPAVQLHPRFDDARAVDAAPSPLPTLLQTPAGLAVIEIQGTIHAPGQIDFPSTQDDMSSSSLQVGRLEFPLHDGRDAEGGAWMRKVYLYIGKHQRLSGEVKKLSKPLLILAKGETPASSMTDDSEMGNGPQQEHLDILAVIKYKILFASRPEPVGS